MQCYTDFYIWNPSTGVNKRIPVSPMILASYSNANTVKLLYGFIYDMSRDDYMVVLGSYKYNYGYNNSIDLEILSLKANKWKQVEIVSHLRYRNTARSTSRPNVGSFLNGSIHWLVYNCQTKGNVIIAFNLKETTMIALPDDFSSGSYDLLVSAGGRISV